MEITIDYTREDVERIITNNVKASFPDIHLYDIGVTMRSYDGPQVTLTLKAEKLVNADDAH